MPTFTMRMADEEHERLAAVVLQTNRTMAEVAREAIVQCVEAFAHSAEAQQRFEAEQRKRDEALELLRKVPQEAAAARARVKVKPGRRS